MPYTLFYTNEIEQGKIDYQKETVPLSIGTNLHGSGIWAASVEKALQAVYDGLDATKRKEDWGLADWPWKGVTNLNSFTKRSKDFSIVAELLNNRKEIIGRQTLQTGGSWEFNLRSRPEVTVSEDDRKTLSFLNVDANKITDNLTIRFVSVNGVNAETAARNGVLQITALSGEQWDFYNNCKIRNGIITSYSGKGGIIVIDNIWGEPVTSIGENVFQEKQLTSVIIGDSVTSIGTWAFVQNKLSSVIIGNSVRFIKDHAFYLNHALLRRITIGANVTLGSNYGVFENAFDGFYKQNGLNAGTYTYNGRQWSYSP